MTSFSTLGICKIQLNPVCTDGLPDASRDPIVVCNGLNLDVNSRIEDGFTVSDPSGIPGKNCIELELPGTKRPPELVFDTCNVFDPDLDAIASACNNVYNDADGNFIGMAAAPKDGDDCLCSCETTEEACNRWDMLVWQLAYCPGSSSSHPPEGKWAITRFPNVEWQPQANTVSLTNELSGSRSYLAIAYEPTGAGYAGPADITPPELPFNACQIGPFLSSVCPPGECGCGGCDSEPETPLARAARRRAAVEATSTETTLPTASELVDA